MRTEQEMDFCEFIAAHRERLRGYAYLLCGDWHRADDLAQQALIKLYVVWPRLSITGVHSYSRKILTNVFLTENRRLWRRREQLRDVDTEVAVVGSDSPDSDVRISVLAALKGLPARQRATIILRYWEDLSVAETAATMRCSAGTVKSQTAKAVKALRHKLPSLNPYTVKELA